MNTHTCKPILKPNPSGVDGQKFRCECGKMWEYVQEGTGYWVPYIKNLPKDESYRKKERQRKRVEAQRVWSD